MKLSGNKRNGRYTSKGKSSSNQSNRQQKDSKTARAASKKKRSRKAAKILISMIVVTLACATVLYCVYKFGVKPPPPVERTPKPSSSIEPSSNSGDNTAVTTPAYNGDRKNEYVRTFVIMGFDDGNGNSDTLMVANFDAVNHTLNVVNIPRDTLVNVAWKTKKINTLYSSGGGIDGVIDGLEDILGFPVDFYVRVNLKGFIELVDAVDGVDFNVPRNMDYDDGAQNLHIQFNAGPTHLDGQEAMEVMRYRKDTDGGGYPDADIGRIGTQQSFLMAAAQQILQKQAELDIYEMSKIFLKYVDTSLDGGGIVWYGKEFYKMDSENITFTTLPGNYDDRVKGVSYVTINVDEWLRVLNEKINPYKEPIKAEELSILTRDSNGKLYVTDGNWAGKTTWG